MNLPATLVLPVLSKVRNNTHSPSPRGFIPQLYTGNMLTTLCHNLTCLSILFQISFGGGVVQGLMEVVVGLQYSGTPAYYI